MPDSTPVTLNVTDITDAVKIIDYAAEAGAFRGWDNIRQVLAHRDRLHAFVTSIGNLNTTESALPQADSSDMTASSGAGSD